MKSTSPKLFDKGFLYFIGGAVIVVGLIFVFAPDLKTSSTETQKDPKDYVLGACRSFIKEVAHNPNSVQFDRVYPDPIIDKSGHYVMLLPYRAQNGFGAVRKSTASCIVSYSNGKFSLVSLDTL